MKIIFKVLKWLVALIAALGAAGYAFVSLHPVFGGKPDVTSTERIKASKAWDGKEFVNAEPTVLQTGENMPSVWEWALNMMNPPEGKTPSTPLPSVKFDAAALDEGEFAWFGHSSAIFRLAGKTVMTDPVFYRASPVPFTATPFKYAQTPAVSQLPRIDAVLISHDHYDHLDYRAIREMDGKVARYFVPLGVRAHLLRWGVANEKITELDLGQSAGLGELSFTLETSRHFSGRALDNRNSTLWGSWVVQAPQMRVFFGGDSGYGAHFRAIGEKYGGFDLAMIECGAYNENWAQIHMMPEQTALAAADLGARALLPIHWAKFDLAYHGWKEPIERLLKASEGAKFDVVTPKIRQNFNLQNLPREAWWRNAE